MTLKNFFSGVLADKQIRANTYITLSVNIILWIAVLIKTQGQARPLPLHFNAFYGIELVDSGLWLFVIPGAGMSLVLMNLWLAKQVAGYDIFLARVLAYGGTVMHLLLAAAVASIFAVSA